MFLPYRHPRAPDVSRAAASYAQLGRFGHFAPGLGRGPPTPAPAQPELGHALRPLLGTPTASPTHSLIAGSPHAAPVGGKTDVLVVGAGAAGIAAARQLLARGLDVVLLEGSERLGGRAHTSFEMGAPFDHGATWVHSAAENPLTPILRRAGHELVCDPHLQRLASSEPAAITHVEQAVTQMAGIWAAHGQAGLDVAAGLTHTPKTRWERMAEHLLGPLSMGVEAREVSTLDFVRMAEETDDALVPHGLGRAVVELGAGLPVVHGAVVTRLEWGPQGVVAWDQHGRCFVARVAVLTASVGVLASGALGFAPELPAWKLDCLRHMRMAHLDKIALQFSHNVFGDTPATTHLLPQALSEHAVELLIRPLGLNRAVAFVGGETATALASAGEEQAVRFVLELLETSFGPGLAEHITHTLVTQWAHHPLTLGAYSAVSPGFAHVRRVLAQPVDNVLYFAGEACSEHWAGCLPGAWETGVAAAEAVAAGRAAGRKAASAAHHAGA